MSVTIMARVLWTTIPKLQLSDKNKRSCESISAKLTMLAIADSADDYGKNSCDSFGTLAIKSGLERRSVIRVIQALIFNEYISLSGISRYGTNNYSINLDKLGNPRDLEHIETEGLG